MDTKALEILSAYQRDVERWKANNAHYRDIQPLNTAEVLYIKHVLHPTAKAESKKVTEQLVKFICDKGICTAKDIYEDLGLSDKPVLKRLRILQQFALVKREGKKYYMPTPRLIELRNRYLKRICS